MILTYLRRGLAVGLLAGLLAGLFAFFVAEPALDRAILLEERAQAAGHSHEEEPFGRGEQKFGLILATTLYGAAGGTLFGLFAAYFRRRSPNRSEWERSLLLSATVFLGAVLLPFLKYPPNPPGFTADPSTLTGRTVAYLVMVTISLLAVPVAYRFGRGLEGVGRLARALISGAVLLGLWTLLYFAMPGFSSAGAEEAPTGLLLEFRLSSLGTQAVLWTAIGCLFGLLGQRRERREVL